MKNNFKKNGQLVVIFETAEERAEILRILEEQRGFHFDEEQKRLRKPGTLETRTLVINLKRKTCRFGVQPFIGAAMASSGVRFYSAREFFRLAELRFRTVPRFPVFFVPHGWDLAPENGFFGSAEPFGSEARRFIPRAYYGGDMTEQARGSKEEQRERLRVLCGRHPRVLLFELRVSPEETLRDPERGIPDVRIGTDPDYTPEGLLRRLEERLQEAGLTYEADASGEDLVPDAVRNGEIGCDLIAVRLEVGRDSFCDRAGNPEEEKVLRIRSVLDRLVVDCADI